MSPFHWPVFACEAVAHQRLEKHKALYNDKHKGRADPQEWGSHVLIVDREGGDVVQVGPLSLLDAHTMLEGVHNASKPPDELLELLFRALPA